jgi:hypothetical protein
MTTDRDEMHAARSKWTDSAEATELQGLEGEDDNLRVVSRTIGLHQDHPQRCRDLKALSTPAAERRERCEAPAARVSVTSRGFGSSSAYAGGASVASDPMATSCASAEWVLVPSPASLMSDLGPVSSWDPFAVADDSDASGR